MLRMKKIDILYAAIICPSTCLAQETRTVTEVISSSSTITQLASIPLPDDLFKTDAGPQNFSGYAYNDGDETLSNRTTYFTVDCPSGLVKSYCTYDTDY